MNEPLVSIITPAYNCKNTVCETYKSIKTQSFSSWEWIVVEDFSTDETYSLLLELAKNDSRIVLLRTPKNSGAAVARNVGIKNAKGRYIAFLDSDDLWTTKKLELQIKFMEDNGYAFTYTDYYLLFDDGSIKEYKSKLNEINYKTLLKRNDIGCLTAIYDSKILDKVFMPLDCEKREDHGMWLDLTRNGLIAYKLSECLATYRIGSGSVSSNKTKMLKYQYLLYRKHEKFNVIKSLWYLFLCSFNKLFNKY